MPAEAENSILLVTESPLLPDWENEHGREIEIVTDPEDNSRVCTDSNHPGVKVRLFLRAWCEQCSGSDDYEECRDFCPVCDFCCGC